MQQNQQHRLFCEMESREGCGKSFLSLHSPGLVPAQLKDRVASMQQCRAGSPDGHGSSILQFSFLLLATGDLQGLGHHNCHVSVLLIPSATTRVLSDTKHAVIPRHRTILHSAPCFQAPAVDLVLICCSIRAHQWQVEA
ncbi:uncharacterized protein CIMG_12728 [Coccidioides immitis RS]|uniref:Uncharacterized protein n=1 Tax=Coccidioides immitis (strain RS) TaxID=246410 RepID=A0A0D8JSX7_COCIM|nr:uncharacterized protein CIMG_12728 [Coccidioides immitis RS]KJF60081.1 hypothetical protein CIMG_12728 [Coccidioides immitis RS]